MGVPGLFDTLKPVSQEISLMDLKGLVLGVDGYGWLHRGTFSCAADLVAGKQSTRYLDYFDKRITLLSSCGISLYFVFDGADLPIKSRINSARAERRASARASLGSNPTPAAAKQALNVTSEMAAAACAYLKGRGIPYIVAPFEADAQLVHLEQQGIIDAIMSEDSDLFIFGCKKLVAKLKDTTAVLVDFSRVSQISLFSTLNGLQDMRAVAIISGCDYSPGIMGMGVKKAAQLVSRTGNLENALNALGSAVPDDFRQKARTAELCFQYQRVWDVKTKSLITLNTPDDDIIDEVTDEIIGGTGHTTRMASGFVCPNTGADLVLHPSISLYIAKTSRFTKSLSPLTKQSDYRRRANRLFAITNTPKVASPFFKAKPGQEQLLTPNPDANKENIPPPSKASPAPASALQTTPTPATRTASLPSPQSSPPVSPLKASASASLGDRVLFRSFSQSFGSRTFTETVPPPKRPALGEKLDLSRFAYRKT